MSFKSWMSYWDYSAEVRLKNRYVHSPETDEFLAEVVRTSKTRERRIPAGTEFWRSQTGNAWRPMLHEGEKIGDVPIPLPPEKMIPLPHLVSGGRVNSVGIPCLYLAYDKVTAMSEVRPWVGAYVSVATFKTKRDLNIVDCSVHFSKDPLFFWQEPNEEEKNQAVWTHIDQAFSKPVSAGDEPLNYTPTQILAELFRNEGYDGIWYKSALSDGFNMALFDIDSAALVSCQLHEVSRLQYSFEGLDKSYTVTS